MGRKPKATPPPEGGAVQSTAEPVRDEVKRMSGHASEDEMAAALPDNTMQAPEVELTPTGRIKKPRKLKEAPQPSADPLMSDPVYAEAVKDMQAFGGAGLVKGGFSTAAVALKDESIALQKDEAKRVDGYFYVMSKKYNVLDPTQNWILMALYFFGLLGSLIFQRVARKKGENMIQQVMKWFAGDGAEAPAPDAREGMDK